MLQAVNYKYKFSKGQRCCNYSYLSSFEIHQICWCTKPHLRSSKLELEGLLWLARGFTPNPIMSTGVTTARQQDGRVAFASPWRVIVATVAVEMVEKCLPNLFVSETQCVGE